MDPFFDPVNAIEHYFKRSIELSLDQSNSMHKILTYVEDKFNVIRYLIPDKHISYELKTLIYTMLNNIENSIIKLALSKHTDYQIIDISEDIDIFISLFKRIKKIDTMVIKTITQHR